jgi:PadR family transcriptional regulator, regulatory protein PadR
MLNDRLLNGTMDLLLLDLLADAPSYGYEIAQAVRIRSAGFFDLKEGALYPALHKLERDKLLRSFWRVADGRRRKYYELTALGRKAREKGRNAWTEFSQAVGRVLGPAREIAPDALPS